MCVLVCDVVLLQLGSVYLLQIFRRNILQIAENSRIDGESFVLKQVKYCTL